MHPQNLIDTVVAFEKDLATFYQKLEDVERFKDLQKILQFMHKHSDIHAELIRNLRSDASLPALNIEPLHTLHQKIKSALTQQLLDTEDLEQVYEKLAHAEALTSQIYATISGHYHKMSEVYARLGQNFKNLADDEMQHYNHIQGELELYKKLDES